MDASDQDVRAAEHLAVAKREGYERADRLFARLMVLQWLAGVAAALLISPRTWAGGESYLHPHVVAAFFLGGAISALPVYLANKHAGKVWTRHIIAIAQMLMSSLFVHLSGGRIETHFHVFGSLAFLAFYRDWRVLITATVVAGLDHFLRGLFWPETVYGVLASSNWRTLEHVGWVLFEDIVLWISMSQSIREMSQVADRRAALEGANEQLKTSESRLAEAQAVAHVGNWDWDLVTKKVTWSNEQYRLFGFAPGEIEPSYEHYFSCIHPDDRQAARNFKDEVLANKKDADAGIDLRVVQPDGQVRLLHRRAHVISDPAGNAVRLAGTMQDITAAVQASEERTRLVMATAHDPLIGMDSTGIITDWNPQAEATFGWSRAEAFGKPLHELIIPPEFREMHVRGLKHFLATGEGPVLNKLIEVSALHRDGRTLPIELRISPIPSGDTFIFTASLRDITERKQAEAELLHAKEAAEASTQAKSEFLANMSHEIRTPMNGILGMTELVLDTQLNSEQREYLDMAHTSAQLLLSLINNILDFSKIEAGKMEMESIEFNLPETITQMLEPLRLRAKLKALAVNVEIADDVPDHVVGDPQRLRQILLNFADNALKFTEHGSIAVKVRIDSDANICQPVTINHSGPCLHFSVTDTGIGIPKEKQEVIFEAFAQVDGSTTRNYGGTGLGLAIASQLIEQMGGKVWIESKVGQGTTFHFTARFGVKSDLASSIALAPASVAASPAATLQGQLRILLVEDNVINRAVATAFLQKSGHTLVHAGNGREAVEAAANEYFDAILMDVQLPEMDGLEATRRIRESEQATGRRTPIIAMTAHAMAGDRERCLASGMDGYLSKPLEKGALTAILKSVSKHGLIATPAVTFTGLANDDGYIRTAADKANLSLSPQ